MARIRIAATLGLLLGCAAAHAQVSSTITLVNDYDFRGISLSAKDPALQASLDWAHDSGFYAGAWASNADFGEGSGVDYEIDLYAGFGGELENGWAWNAGVVYYLWPGGEYPDGSSLDYPEFSVGAGYKGFSTKFWYSPDYSALDEDGYYLEGNYTFELPQNFTFNVHAGYSFGDYWKNLIGDESLDYSLGVGYTAKNFNLLLKYVDTESDVIVTDDVFNNEGRLVFSVATTLPWGDEE